MGGGGGGCVCVWGWDRTLLTDKKSAVKSLVVLSEPSLCHLLLYSHGSCTTVPNVALQAFRLV